MNILIRKMTEADVEQVAAIDRASFSLPWPLRAFEGEVGSPFSRCWVAELNGQVVGVIVVWLVVDEAHIATIASHPEFRRQGIGEKLLLSALDAVKKEGAERVTLEARESNIAALSMYKKHGFQEEDRRPKYYKDNNEDAITMSLNLGGGLR